MVSFIRAVNLGVHDADLQHIKELCSKYRAPYRIFWLFLAHIKYGASTIGLSVASVSMDISHLPLIIYSVSCLAITYLCIIWKINFEKNQINGNV